MVWGQAEACNESEVGLTIDGGWPIRYSGYAKTEESREITAQVKGLSGVEKQKRKF